MISCDPFFKKMFEMFLGVIIGFDKNDKRTYINRELFCALKAYVGGIATKIKKMHVHIIILYAGFPRMVYDFGP